MPVKILQILFLLQSVFFYACKSLQHQVPGTYIEYNLHDTLQLFTNNSYGYDEMLMNGMTGWTQGNWTINNKKIVFTSQVHPLMGFGLKILKKSPGDHPIFRLMLGNSDKPVEITGVIQYKNDSASAIRNAIISGNSLELLSTGFDSVAINTFDFTAIVLKPNLFVNQSWELQIYPTERYYVLDKYIFRYKKKELCNIVNNVLPPVQVIFKKVSESTEDSR